MIINEVQDLKTKFNTKWQYRAADMQDKQTIEPSRIIALNEFVKQNIGKLSPNLMQYKNGWFLDLFKMNFDKKDYMRTLGSSESFLSKFFRLITSDLFIRIFYFSTAIATIIIASFLTNPIIPIISLACLVVGTVVDFGFKANRIRKILDAASEKYFLLKYLDEIAITNSYKLDPEHILNKQSKFVPKPQDDSYRKNSYTKYPHNPNIELIKYSRDNLFETSLNFALNVLTFNIFGIILQILLTTYNFITGTQTRELENNYRKAYLEKLNFIREEIPLYHSLSDLKNDYINKVAENKVYKKLNEAHKDDDPRTLAKTFTDLKANYIEEIKKEADKDVSFGKTVYYYTYQLLNPNSDYNKKGAVGILDKFDDKLMKKYNHEKIFGENPPRKVRSFEKNMHFSPTTILNDPKLKTIQSTLSLLSAF